MKRNQRFTAPHAPAGAAQVLLKQAPRSWRAWLLLSMLAMVLALLGVGHDAVATLEQVTGLRLNGQPSLGVEGAAGAFPFADQRSWMGLPNAADVLSNLPFILLGFYILFLWMRSSQAIKQSVGMALMVLALGLIATGVGSSYYHLEPDNWRLLCDRWGMVMPFAALLALAMPMPTQNETGLPPVTWANNPWVLGLHGVLGAGAAALAYTAHHVLAWGVFQLGGMLLLVMWTLKPSPSQRTRSAPLLIAWTWVLILYALAKVVEGLDRAIFSLTGELISGHTLKHLLACAAVVPVAWALRCSRMQALGFRLTCDGKIQREF